VIGLNSPNVMRNLGIETEIPERPPSIPVPILRKMNQLRLSRHRKADTYAAIK
jgi:hypothetical protein